VAGARFLAAKVVTRVLSLFNKKKVADDRLANDPEVEAAVRARFEQDSAYLQLHKEAEVEHWDRIRDRVEQ
jgi:hypothetical protein